MKDPVTFAVAQCPFLSKVAAQNGPEYARSIAIDPTQTVGLAGQKDSLEQYEASFQLFHGPSGIVPLVQAAERREQPASGGCPFHALHSAAKARSEATADCVTSSKPLPRTLPLATISLSSGSGSFFGDFLRNKLHNKQPSSKRPPSQRQPPATNSNSHQLNSSLNQPNPSSSVGSNTGFKPQRPLTDPSSSGGGLSSNGAKGLGGTSTGASSYSHGPQPPSASSAAAGSINGLGAPGNSLGSLSSSGGSAAPFNGFSSSSGVNGPGAGPSPFKGFANSSNSTRPTASGGPARGPRTPGASSSRSIANGSSASAPAPQCPLRKWLGPVAGLVFNEYDKLVCPPPIVAARAALAKTAAVQQLRPQKLPVKLVAVAAVSAAANVPCGAVREHFEKFSLGWFIAVHATIPFVAMLRKAVLMPKYSIMVTIASAVLGQMIGSRLERARLQQHRLAASALTPGVSLAAAAPSDAKTAISSSSSGKNKSAGSMFARDAAWKEKLLAGGRAGLVDTESSGATAGLCAADVADAGTVFSGSVGLGSLLPQLPVVKAQ